MATDHRLTPLALRARSPVDDLGFVALADLADILPGIDSSRSASRIRRTVRMEPVRRGPAPTGRGQAVLATAPPAPKALTIDQVTETLTALHEVPDLLASADPADRAGLYQALGVSLAYRRSESIEEVKLLVSLGVGLRRVGRGTCKPTPRPVMVETGWSELPRSS
jgi:hypothetical protein